VDRIIPADAAHWVYQLPPGAGIRYARVAYWIPAPLARSPMITVTFILALLLLVVGTDPAQDHPQRE
jgi:hypothetical protein